MAVICYIVEMENKEKLSNLENIVKALYEKHKKRLLFHGWHHIFFVKKKAGEFAEMIGADVFLVESSALVHDINYLILPNSDPKEGKELRQKMLREANYSEQEIDRIEQIILEEHTTTRDLSLSLEGQALSDADTLFKALPITPILFAGKYIEENGIDIRSLAEKICEE